MDNLFIVKSPLQVINSLEAINYFQVVNNVLIVIKSKEKANNNQMQSLIKNHNWKNIYYIENNNRSKFFQELKFIKKLQKQKYNFLFLSNLTTIHKLILANIKRNETYYIDDGIETVIRYNNELVPNKINKFKIKHLRYYLFGLSTRIYGNINLFTYFDLKPFRDSKIIKNNLTNFQCKYLKNSNPDNILYFIGQPLVTNKLLSEDHYFQYLNYIISISNKKIVYIPHRLEIQSNRLKSYNSGKFEIRNINIPIELYFLENNIYPYSISSFFSSALFTLNKLYKKTMFSYVYITNNKILKKQQDIEDAYKFIDTLNIQKIELNH